MITTCTVQDIITDPKTPELLELYKAEGERLSGAEFNPDQYLALEAAGILTVFKAQNSEGVTVGFGTVICNKVPHYKTPIGVVESIFIKKSARRSGIGLDMLIAMEAHCRKYCRCMFITAPVESALQRVLPRLGFTLSNLVFLKDFNA